LEVAITTSTKAHKENYSNMNNIAHSQQSKIKHVAINWLKAGS